MQVIRDFVEKYHIEAQTFAVGVSGGADSLALALIFKEAYPQYRIVALSVDHGLRPTSRKEAEYVAKIMEQYGIEHHILTWKGKKPTTGIEEAARIARYDLLCKWCHQHHIEYLAIAHHLRDQAETFLLRLQRGSGLFGLSSMQEVSERNGIKILRPLLNVSPNALKEYLSAHHLTWVEDESNQCLDFLRVRIRQFLPTLEKETGITLERIALAVENLQNTRRFIDSLVQDVISSKIHTWQGCAFSLDYAEFKNWHNELKFYVFNELLSYLSPDDYVPEAQSVLALISHLSTQDFAGETLGGVYCCVMDLRIWLIKENRNKKIDITEDEWLDFSKKNPFVRGVKIPYKLKQALIHEKKQQK